MYFLFYFDNLLAKQIKQKTTYEKYFYHNDVFNLVLGIKQIHTKTHTHTHYLNTNSIFFNQLNIYY